MTLGSSQNDYRVSYNAGHGNVSINFNICDYAFRTCPDDIADFANMIN